MNSIKDAANVHVLILKDYFQNDGFIFLNINTYSNEEKHQLEM